MEKAQQLMNTRERNDQVLSFASGNIICLLFNWLAFTRVVGPNLMFLPLTARAWGKHVGGRKTWIFGSL